MSRLMIDLRLGVRDTLSDAARYGRYGRISRPGSYFLFSMEAKVPDPIRRIAINTGGGDAPGLNAVIRAVVLAAGKRGWECYGIRDGFNGMLDARQLSRRRRIPLTLDHVRGIAHLGGTILGTTNKGNPLRFPVAQARRHNGLTSTAPTTSWTTSRNAGSTP